MLHHYPMSGISSIRRSTIIIHTYKNLLENKASVRPSFVVNKPNLVFTKRQTCSPQETFCLIHYARLTTKLYV